MRRLLSLLTMLLALWLLPAAPSVAAGAERLSVVSAAGRHDFRVELALTPEQHARGLMFRSSMAPDAGMLFVFPGTAMRSFWMKNTLIPLDMLFIGADGRIATIHAGAMPHSLAPISSVVPVKAVLEINGGLSARLGIRPGDRVEHPAFR